MNPEEGPKRLVEILNRRGVRAIGLKPPQLIKGTGVRTRRKKCDSQLSGPLADQREEGVGEMHPDQGGRPVRQEPDLDLDYAASRHRHVVREVEYLVGQIVGRVGLIKHFQQMLGHRILLAGVTVGGPHVPLSLSTGLPNLFSRAPKPENFEGIPVDRGGGLEAALDTADRIAALEGAGIDRVALEIADYAGRCLNRRRLGRGDAVDLDPESLTQEAIARFLDGRWTWSPERDPSIAEFLKSRIPSLISNALRSGEYRKGREIPRHADGSEDVGAITPQDPRDPNLSDLHAVTLGPDEVLLEKIAEALADRFWEELEAAVKEVSDPTVRMELEAVLVAVYARKELQEIAQATGLPQNVVYRRFSKLGDMAEKVASDLTGTIPRGEGGEGIG